MWQLELYSEKIRFSGESPPVEFSGSGNQQRLLIARVALAPILQLAHSADEQTLAPLAPDLLAATTSIGQLCDIFWVHGPYDSKATNGYKSRVANMRGRANRELLGSLGAQAILSHAGKYRINSKIIAVSACEFVWQIADAATAIAEVEALLKSYEKQCHLAEGSLVLLCGLKGHHRYEDGDVSWIVAAEARLQEFYLRGLERLFRAQQTGAVPLPLADIAGRLSQFQKWGVLPANQALLDKLCAEIIAPDALNQANNRVLNLDQQTSCSTLSEAIKAAHAGETLHIFPGVYAESLTLDKPLKLIGQGRLSETCIESQGAPCFTLCGAVDSGEVLTLRNLTLRQRGRRGVAALLVQSGNPLVDACDISGQGRSCVAVAGTASPCLHANRISGGRRTGIFYCESAAGVLEKNSIAHNGFRGVEICSTSDTVRPADPILRRNLIHENGDDGVHVCDYGRGLLEMNSILSNACAGISIRCYGEPTVGRSNNIHDNFGDGIYAQEEARGTIENCSISNNTTANVSVKSGAHLILRDVKILNGNMDGIYVHERGKVTLEGNEIIGNRHAGVVIKELSWGHFGENNFEDNGEDAVRIQSGSSAVIVGQTNTFAGNGGKDGFQIEPECQPDCQVV